MNIVIGTINNRMELDRRGGYDRNKDNKKKSKGDKSFKEILDKVKKNI